ncbi:MAG: hypothetical protein INR73_11725 [Williamsia sp.]|nr:hypothetical protein [Williamsia sp.]
MTGPGNIISKLQRRWVFIALLSDGLLALAVTLVVVALLRNHAVYPWWVGLLIFFPALLVAGIRHRCWKWEPVHIARYLNSRMPQFQESAQLLLKPVASRSQLEQLQASRIEQAISTAPLPFFPNKNLGWSVIVLFFSIILAQGLYPLPDFFLSGSKRGIKQSSLTAKQATKEKTLAGISSIRIRIQPPAYTREPALQQTIFTIQTLEGSLVNWEMGTSQPVKQVQLVFNDKEAVALRAADSSHTKWAVQKKLVATGFYQVKIEDRLSEMYMIDLAKDAPPQVRIIRPQQYTTIDFGEPQRITIHVSAQDDYGLSQASMTATIASGSGEAVKFKEQQLPLSGPVTGRRETLLQRGLDLRALGMKPGDELYYYVSATDNAGQETRSDVYNIILPDTAQLMEIEGLANAVDLKQEYFRSQRQIIIETEQLLKDHDTVPTPAFNNKSNNLGIDQKLLRLRYGKFLGEENEDEPGEEREHAGEEHEQPVLGDATKLMEQYTHRHDNAEDATFFDPKQKAQLRAVLSEMWKAELQLRLYKPAQALPFEYKALRLLKDLQQQSRSYVAKAAYKTTPLRPEKRLTADLSKIVEPVTHRQTKAADRQHQALRDAGGILESLKHAPRLAPAAIRTLQSAAQQLGTSALEKPGTYLASFEAIKRVLGALDRSTSLSATDIQLAERGLNLMLSRPEQSPRQEQTGTQQNLSKQYFKNLQQTNR